MKQSSQSLAEILSSGPLRTHLIGVAGSGMSGIAALLLALGHRVSGSDKADTIEVRRLESLGLKFDLSQEAAHVAGADIVIYSSAIRPGNVEYDEAVRLGLRMFRRADALSAIMLGKKGVVIAGMHGKTTTSSMMAHVLRTAGVRPSHYVGAEIPILGTNAHWDAEGELFVAEGDESDGTLANYHPEHAVILNIEEEHLDFYADLAAIEVVFNRLLDQTAGLVLYCADDAHATRLCATRPRAISFGEGEGADYRFRNFGSADFQSTFEVVCRGEVLGELVLNVPGRHNVSNAMSVVALATELGVPFAKIAEGLKTFSGARRRFEIKHRGAEFLVVDDYAHHPSELRATLATARTAGRQRILALFQPHRYTRTQALKDEFGRAFGDADLVFLADIYPASEPPIPGISGQTIADALAANGHTGARFIPDRDALVREVGRLAEPGDCIITVGAGNIHEQGSALARDLAALEALRAEMGPGALRLYEPLARHTTLRVGGPAQFWAEPETEAGLARLLAWCHAQEMPVTLMGRGSNLLIRDGGIRGVVIHLAKGEFHRLEREGHRLTAGAGVRLKEVALAAKAAGLAGLEWMEGIPGSVGGGLRMNAGAMGGEAFNHVASVRLIDAAGEVREQTPAELEIGYRSVPELKTRYVLSAVFEATPGDAAEIARRLDESMQKRRTTQPRESSAGCIFKNPGPCPAGRLVDELGLKNRRVGGARVSEIHGNFIVNDGGATATDVLRLIAEVKAVALAERGIALETEVQIVGEEAPFILS